MPELVHLLRLHMHVYTKWLSHVRRVVVLKHICFVNLFSHGIVCRKQMGVLKNHTDVMLLLSNRRSPLMYSQISKTAQNELHAYRTLNAHALYLYN